MSSTSGCSALVRGGVGPRPHTTLTPPPAEFPERPGALRKFLLGLQSDWSITLFHYRNHGSDVGKVLVGVRVPPTENGAWDDFLRNLGFPCIEETDNLWVEGRRWCA